MAAYELLDSVDRPAQRIPQVLLLSLGMHPPNVSQFVIEFDEIRVLDCLCSCLQTIHPAWEVTVRGLEVGRKWHVDHEGMYGPCRSLQRSSCCRCGQMVRW